jgi:hypothetical protein
VLYRRVRASSGETRTTHAIVAIAISALAAVLLVAVAGLADQADAQAPLVLDPHGVSISAYGGWAAWSRFDAATSQYALALRSPGGTTSLAPVAERGSPFDVELGPSGAGVAAVYSRCTEDAVLRGCNLAELELGENGATEREIRPPGGGSNHEPAISGNTIVFLRRNAAGGSENPSRPGRRPDSLFAWKIGSRKPRPLALPASKGSRTAPWPSGLTGLVTGLAFNGRQLAYTTANVVGSFGETSLWFQPLGGRPQLIDQETGGAGNVCQPAFLSPVLAGRWLYAYLHACDPSGAASFDRFTRYRRGAVERARATLIQSGDEAITSVVADGAGLDWDSEGVRRLASVSWRRINAPVTETFCNRADPFC